MRKFLLNTDLSDKDFIFSGGYPTMLKTGFVQDETGSNLPVLDTTPTTVPAAATLGRNCTLTEIFDNGARYWEYSKVGNTWSFKGEVLTGQNNAVIDSNSIDFSLSGSNVTGDVKYSTDINNVAGAGSDGAVYVKDISIATGSSNNLSYNPVTRELSVTALAITSTTVDSTEASFGDFVTANYTGSEYQEGDIIYGTNYSQTWIHNGGVAGTIADFTQISTPTAFALTLDGDTGSAQALASGDTITIAGGIGTNTVAGATDTITVNLDINKIAAEVTLAATDTFAFYDASATAVRKVTLANLEAGITHDNLNGVSANEHIDHTSVTFTAGVGLTGGGTLAANRTFDLNITGLGAATADSADEIAIYDVSGVAHGKITLSAMVTAVTEEIQDVAGALVATGGTKSGISVVYDDVNNDMDFICTLQNITNQANGLDLTLNSGNIEVAYDFTELSLVATPDIAVDRMIIYDSDGTSHGYVTIASLLDAAELAGDITFGTF